jgi:hypothetical protein
VPTIDSANRCVVGLAYGLHLANGERLGSLCLTTRCGPEARHVPTIDFCQPLCFLGWLMAYTLQMGKGWVPYFQRQGVDQRQGTCLPSISANRCVFGLAYGLHLANGKRLGSLVLTTRCGPEAGRCAPTTPIRALARACVLV